jgi:hypothetical protein
MSQVETENGSVLSYTDYLGPGWVWRAVDFLAGVAFLSLAYVFSKSTIFLYGFAAVGGYFSLRGLTGLLYTRGVAIDRASGSFRVWRGFLFPLWFRTRRLNRYATVDFGMELRREGRTYSNYYTVKLGGDGASDQLTAKKNYLEARRLAEQVARYLDFDLVDATSGQPVRVAAKNVGKSLREAIRETQKPGELDVLALAPLPPRSRCTCTVDGAWLFLEVPRRRFVRVIRYPLGMGISAGAIGALLGFGFGALAAKQPGAWHEHVLPALAITLGFGIVGFLFTALVTLPEAFVRYQIEANPAALTVRRRGLIFRRTDEVTSDDLRDLQVSCGRLRAIGRERIFQFGNDDLSPAELEWLRAAITKALAA